MPFAVRPITPTAMSLGPVPENIGNEFDCVMNHTLAQAMRQMASLLKQADDIFGNLQTECAAINNTTKNIKNRVASIEETVKNMNPKKEKIPSGDLASFSKLKTHFKREYQIDKNLFTRDNRPEAIVTLYNCTLYNKEMVTDQQEKSVAPSYLCIPILTGTYPGRQKYVNVETETKRILNEYNLTIRGRQKTRASGCFIQEPEEKRQALSPPARSVSSEVVTVDVSGKHFTKMAETTRAHQESATRRKSRKMKEKCSTLTLTGGEPGANPFEGERISLGESDRSFYSEATNCSDSERSYNSAPVLIQSESDKPFYHCDSPPDSSDSRSMTVTPLPDMETVSVVNCSVPNRKCDSFNPFLDEVINPFMDFKPPTKHRKTKKDNKEDESGKGFINLKISDVQSSTSTIFEENNPFFDPENEGPGTKSEVVSAAEECNENMEDEMITKKSHFEKVESTSMNNYALDTLDTFEGLDEVVKELELLALREQERYNEEQKKTCAEFKPRPDPPKRFSSLYKDSDDTIAQEESSLLCEVDRVIVPVCLSVETKKRQLYENRMSILDIHYKDTEKSVEDGEIPVSEKHESDMENVLKHASESINNTNNGQHNENILLLAPDVVITNKEELTKEAKGINYKNDYKIIKPLPDMLTHVTESNQSQDSSNPINSPDIPECSDDNAGESSANMSKSESDSAFANPVASSGQFRYEASRLRISEPFVKNNKGNQVEDNVKSNAPTQICESSQLQLNSWELPDADTSYSNMEQQWRFADRGEQQQQQEGQSGNSQQLQHPGTGTPQEQMGGKKMNKKESFFKSLKNRFSFSNKSKKTSDDINSNSSHQSYYESLDGPLHFQYSDLPRMTSTPLTRSASTRDSRGLSCTVSRPNNLGRISESSDCPKFGGDLPASYRTAALKNQHQRWSFAAASTSSNQIDVPAQELYDYSIIKQGTQIPNPALTCECPMCYHSCRNTCTICGCPNGTLKSQTPLKHVEDVSADIQTSSYSSYSSYPTVPNMQIRSSTPIQVTETLGHLNGKLKTLPSRSIQELYSQRKSSSPDILGYQRTFDGDPGRTNLYKPTSLQDFKNLLSQSSVAQYQHKDLLDNVDREYNGAEKNTNTTFKNSSSLKKPFLWMDNRFSIIQEEPDLQEKRKSEEDLLQGGFLV